MTPLIMVVEDNKITQETLKRDLTALGLEVWQMYSSEEALNALNSADKVPHVLVLDFHLPGEDGPGFYRRLAADPRFRHIPMIPFTALVGQNDGTSIAMVASYVESRDTRNPTTQPIVSKKGREEVFETPPELILSIGHALRQQSLILPKGMRDAMRKIIGELMNDINTPA